MVCGRRFGKTYYLTHQMMTEAMRGKYYGYFAPDYKRTIEVYNTLKRRLMPAIKRASQTDRRIELHTGGLIEFWTLEDEDAGRSRRYHSVGIDEAGLVKNLESRWYEAVSPTLMDFDGSATFAGTPKGRGFFQTLYDKGQDPELREYSSWQLPTSVNTTIPNIERIVEEYRRELPDRVFRQEILAEFIDDAGGVFRGVKDCIRSGAPCDTGYIGIDLAKVQDFTVISVVGSNGVQQHIERFNQISWERQIEAIIRVAGMFPKYKLLIDSTGVGDPIFERLRTIIPGRVEGYQLTNSSKEALIENLAMRIEAQAVSLMNDPVQTSELQAYQYELTPSRNVRMNAPAGMHDDTVIALALACWQLRDRKRSEWSSESVLSLV